MPANRDRFIDELLARAGSPYVWGGNGLWLWTPKGLVIHSWTQPVYDCVGLVKVALLSAGGPDLRATHNAQSLYDASTPAAVSHRPGNLLFYGENVSGVVRVEHVAVVVGCGACQCATLGAKSGYVKIEAAGGGRGTVEPQRDPLGPARVMPRRENRRDVLGEYDLPHSMLDL
jgi:hypothetical protein